MPAHGNGRKPLQGRGRGRDSRTVRSKVDSGAVCSAAPSEHALQRLQQRPGDEAFMPTMIGSRPGQRRRPNEVRCTRFSLASATRPSAVTHSQSQPNCQGWPPTPRSCRAQIPGDRPAKPNPNHKACLGRDASRSERVSQDGPANPEAGREEAMVTISPSIVRQHEVQRHGDDTARRTSQPARPRPLEKHVHTKAQPRPKREGSGPA